MSIRFVLPAMLLATFSWATVAWAPVALAEEPAASIDPLVKASAYADKSVWSYHDSKPVPWARFKPKDFGGTKVPFSATGVRDVGTVPAPGIHPRMFFGPEDLPGIRQRLKQDAAGQAAWLNILAWSHALRLTYDEKADYAQPDWANGGFRVRGRFVDLMRIGGYDPKRENYYAILAAGGSPKRYEKDAPSNFFRPAANEAFRVLIDDDAAAGQTLAKAVVQAIRLEQERRAKNDKPVEPGQPPKPSTNRGDASALGFVYDFIFNYMTPEQKQIVHDELVTLSAWADNYGTFNNAEASRSNWATFSYWVFDLMALEGEPGFNDLKFLGLYRGWRNFFTYSFFDSGAAYEAEGKLLFGLEAVVAFDRIAKRYGLEPLSQHPLPRSYYGKFSANAMLPTRDRFVVFDILGSMGGGFTTPHDLVVAKWLFPQDKTTDFVYRALVGDDYRELPHSIHSHWQQAIISAIFATAYDPDNSPEKLNLPLSFFCGQRALMMTRSSWDKDATFLTMHVRGASGGHPYPDRGGIMLAAQGRPWVTIPGKDAGSWACSTVVIDGAAQNPSTPGRVVDYTDQPNATFMTGDASSCWNWVWAASGRNLQGKEVTRADVDASNVDLRRSWSLVEQSFNDFAFTKATNPIYNRPLKYNASWIGFDGLLNPMMRQVNTPVLTSFRSAGIVRGTHPYILVVDDAQRDGLAARYDWNLTLMADVVQADASKLGGAEGDIILVGKDSLGADGTVKPGDPALLVRVLEAQGTRLGATVGLRGKINLLCISTQAPSPAFKVLVHAFRIGGPLPTTTWDDARRSVQVAFPEQTDAIACTPAASGRTELVVRRDGKVIASLNQPVPALKDPASDTLLAAQRQVAPRVASLLTQGFDPAKLPGFVAGWPLTELTQDAFPPLPGSAANAQPIAMIEGTELPQVEGGGKAVLVGKNPLALNLDPTMVGNGPVTMSVWVKTKPGPFMGRLVEAPGLASLSFVQGGLTVNAPGGGLGSWSSAMLSSWTHLAVTWDGKAISAYRNGILMVRDEAPRKIALGKVIRLGGADAYGNAEVQVRDVMLYRGALSAEAVGDLHLWGRHGSGQP